MDLYMRRDRARQVAGGLNSMLEFWIPENLNDGHLEWALVLVHYGHVWSMFLGICWPAPRSSHSPPDAFVRGNHTMVLFV